MKFPDLNYNYYFPYYTQSCVGKKKFYCKTDTVIHLSDNRGILLSICYKKTKICKIIIEELVDCHVLFDYRGRGKLLHYTEFAKEVEKVFKMLSIAIRQLSSERAYKKTLIFTTYIKHSECIEIELGFRRIHVEFDKFDYVIESGQIMRKGDVTVSSNTEESQLMEKLSKAVSAIDANTRLLEIDDKEFSEKLDRSWNYFIEFFKCPKFIKKSEYIPK